MQLAFHIIGLTVTLLNVLTFLALRRRIKHAYPRRSGWITLAVGLPYWLLLHPSIFLLFGGISGLMAVRNEVPMWLGIAAMAFQFAVWVYGGGLMIKGTPGAVIGTVGKIRRALRRNAGTPKERELINHERRQLLAKGALVVPAAIVATAAGGALASRALPTVTRLRLPVRREFTQLHGLTIAQVSDVHIGSYMGWERLSEIQKVMNETGADIHVMTGDLIDNDMEQLELAQMFLRGLKPRRAPVFMCMGNHEYIAARTGDLYAVISALRESGARLLIDETEKIQVGGAHFWLGGLDYPLQMGLPRVHDRTTTESLHKVLDDMKDDGAPRILLSHHPRTFNEIKDAPIDLTLSGHMHGGQISFGRIGDLELTPVLPFELFHRGLYERNNRKLYVNAGAGGWMPVRINCPPEITVVELVADDRL